MKKQLLASLTLLCAAAVLHAAELSGKWKAVFDTQVGKQSYVYELQAVGGKVTGKATSDINGENKRTVELQDGKLVGDRLTFVETFEFQGNNISISYTGKLVGDEIQFTRKVGELATEELVAKREQSESTPATRVANVTGTWKAEFETQRGLQKYTFMLTQKGTNLTGKASVEMTDQKREAEFKEGKVEGDTVTLVEPLKIQDNEIRITYTGKVAGNEIKFTRQVGDFGKSEATAKREGGAPQTCLKGRTDSASCQYSNQEHWN